ncbi:DUF397 domain-containing protein [Streptomyces sp. NBC_01335]|uniref:DUF397 domain-containing protein n=1 Tax=Streptomyces sp. NBC_01335 TaxID=2903828 RepID=UPI002E0ED0F7
MRGGNACLELAAVDGKVLLRESDDPAILVHTTAAKFRAFLEGVKSGEFDDLG